MYQLGEKHKPAGILLLAIFMAMALIFSVDIVSAADDTEGSEPASEQTVEQTSEPIVAVAAEVEDNLGYIGVIEGQDFIPTGIRMNITRGNSTVGYKKIMGMQVFKDGKLQEGFTYSQDNPENGRMLVTISYTEGGNTVSDSFEVDVISAGNVPPQAEDRYYEISTPEQLATFSLMVGAVGMDDINGRLMNDIDMTETEYQPIGQYHTDARKSENTQNNTENQIWGNYYKGFSGKFDGNDKTITFDLTAVRCASLIAFAKNGVEVKNLTIKGNITAKSNGYPAVGAGIIAIDETRDASVTNCTNYADINSGFLAAGILGDGGTNTTVTDCVNEGDIDASNGGNSGGVVGTGKAVNCINRGDVKGGYSHIGGVVGGGSAINCLNTGSVYHAPNQYTNVGGVIGSVTAGGTLKDCVNLGKVTGSNSAGGIAGMTFNSTTKSVIENCYNYGDVTSVKVNFHDGIAGIVGIQAEDIVGLTIKDCYNLGTATHETDPTGAFIGYTPKLPSAINPSTQEFTIEDSYYLDGSADGSSGYIASTRTLNDKSTKVDFEEMTLMLKAKYDDGELPYGAEQMAALEALKTDISKRTIKLSAYEYTYDGTDKTPAVTAIGLSKDDYTVSYSDNIEVGTAKVIIDGKGTYTGSRTIKFEIKKCPLSECTVSKPSNKVYTGEELTQALTVKQGNTVLKEGTDYTISYSDNIYPGTAKVSIKGKGNYEGTVTCSFEIGIPDLAAPSSVKADLYGYNDVKVSWSKVNGASGYYVYCSKAGSSSWSLLGTTTSLSFKKADLADGTQYSFRVYPYQKIKGAVYKDTSYRASSGVCTLKKLKTPSVKKASKNYIKISWSNIPGETGYQIARSKYKTKSFAVVKTVSSKYKTVKIKTTRNKTYYYKIRAYKTVNGEKIYGPWSTVKSYKLK